MTHPAPYAHQVEDTATLIRRPAFGLLNGVGSGKSRIVVDAACALYRGDTIDTLFAVVPAPARSVWADPDPVLGEFAKWATVPYTIAEYHEGTDLAKLKIKGLLVLVTNPEYLRYGSTKDKRGYKLGPHAERLREVLAGRKVLLVADESWLYKSPKASQTKMLYRMRQVCARATVLNGTPGPPKDLYTQFTILDRGIFADDFVMPDGRIAKGVRDWWGFRGRFCKLGGFRGKEIVGYQNLDEFEARTKDYAVYRDTKSCVDLGSTPLRTQIEVPLTPKTWRAYCAMRDELVHWFSENEAAVVQHAAVKTMRLAQITSGFLGGVVDFDDPKAQPAVKELGTEKIDALTDWLGPDAPVKLVVATHFRPDVERTVRTMASLYHGHRSVPLYGGQTDDERTEAKMLLAPGGDSRPAIVCANIQSGQSALNFAASDVCAFLANSWSLKTRQQFEGRMRESVYADRRVTFLDVLATGPKGERTIDHVMLAALRSQEDISKWTADIWRQKIQGE